MKRVFFGLASLLLLSTSALSAGWEWRAWLPDSFVSWWWSSANEDGHSGSYELGNSGEAQSRIGFLSADSLRTELEWPLSGMDFIRWHQAKMSVAVLRNTALPLGHDQLPLLWHDVATQPDIFLGMAQRFAPVHAKVYDDSLTEGFIATLPGAQPIILLARGGNPDWYQGLVSEIGIRPVILIQFEGELDPSTLPAHWTALLLADWDMESEALAAQMLFGAQPIGDLPATVAGFELPDPVDWSPDGLERLDNRMNWAIRRRTAPGAQLTVLHRGQVVWEKAYGHHDFRRRRSVSNDDLFDLASVTKAAATSLSVMYLYERGEIMLQARVKDYLPELDGYPVGRYQVDQLLTHQTGLQADLPAFDYLGRTYVRTVADAEHSLQIAPERWLDATIPAKIQAGLQQLDYTRRPIYRYSDVNYYLLQLIVERVSGEPLDEFVHSHIYNPLGLNRLTFRPLDRIPAEHCVPSIYDPWMREATLQGYVHDEGAALLGGVAGHAGLFGNARDLGRLFQMLLDEGRCGETQIFEPETIELFTSRYGYNYRALGFDRLAGGWPNLIDGGAGEATFGHTGFSGTSVWADPDNELVVVLLTNRVFPDTKNTRFKRYRVRGRVHADVYRALNIDELAR